MLTQAQESEILELIDQGLNPREVAARGVASRCTVYAVLARRGVTLSRERRAGQKKARCPTCGRWIEIPCRACEAEAAVELARKIRKAMS